MSMKNNRTPGTNKGVTIVTQSRRVRREEKEKEERVERVEMAKEKEERVEILHSLGWVDAHEVPLTY